MTVRRIVPDLPDAGSGTDRLLRDVLGLELVMDQGWVRTFAGGSGHQITVMGDDASAPVRPAVSVEVDDVDAAHARAVEAGLEIVHPLTDEPWGVRRFFVRDAGGAVVNVLQHR